MTANTPLDLLARAEMSQAIVTLGRLLPEGMQVLFFHDEKTRRAAIQTTYPDGEQTIHWVEQAMH